MHGNVIVGQSGGPTSVINSSLVGVYKTARDRGARTVYGMLHGVKGLLDKQYVDLSAHIRSDLDIDLLKRTPSSFLGSCRYKLPEIREDRETYEKIFRILEELDIEAFFYIGGNDSMDTIKKLSDYAILVSSDIKFMGVPKTIDNDLAPTTHRDTAALPNTLHLSQKKSFGMALCTIILLSPSSKSWGAMPDGSLPPRRFPRGRTVRALT